MEKEKGIPSRRVENHGATFLRTTMRAGAAGRGASSAILAEDYVELNPARGRAPVTLNFSLDFLICR